MVKKPLSDDNKIPVTTPEQRMTIAAWDTVLALTDALRDAAIDPGSETQQALLKAADKMNERIEGLIALILRGDLNRSSHLRSN